MDFKYCLNIVKIGLMYFFQKYFRNKIQKVSQKKCRTVEFGAECVLAFGS